MIGTLLAYTFYGLTFLAMGYFVHSVLWIARFRTLQANLGNRADARCARVGKSAVQEWNEEADRLWKQVRGDNTDSSPEEYIKRVEQELSTVSEGLVINHLNDVFHKLAREEEEREQGLDFDEAEDYESWNRTPAEPQSEPRSVTVLILPQVFSEPVQVEVQVAIKKLYRLSFPDPERFRLHIHSRYGMKRRLLVFLLGAADVAFSSQHVSRISQHATMPLSVIFRRLSLVLLILLVVLIDVTLGARYRLIVAMQAYWADKHILTGFNAFDEFINQQIPAAIALGLWLLGYGCIYLGLYGYLWLKSKSYLFRLIQLRRKDPEIRERIFLKHEEQFYQWLQAYMSSLDATVDNAVSQARLMVEQTSYRLRLRIAHSILLQRAEETAKKLFNTLPESSTELQDEVTTKKRTWRHRLWPIESDMKDQTEIAQRRSAWQYLQATATNLRGKSPGSVQAIELWKYMIGVAFIFPEFDLYSMSQQLRSVYPQMLEELVNDTELDLHRLDKRLVELCEGLSNNLENIQSFIDTRYELTRQAMGVELDELTAKTLRIRERARLEAMAFEI